MYKSLFHAYKTQVVLAMPLYVAFCFITGGENLAIISFLAVIALGLPLYHALSSRYESLIYFHATAFVTMLVTLPYFFTVRRENWYLAGFNRFDYSIYSTSVLLFYLGFFLLLVSLFVRFWEKIKRPPDLSQLRNSRPLALMRRWKPQRWCTWAIVFIIAIFAPIQYWMFQEAIGFTGITPRRLPFKLTGILYYSTKLFIPLLIGILYYKSPKRSLLTLTILIYGVYSSTFAASKGVGVLIIGLVVLVALTERKNLRAVVGLVFMAVAMSLAVYMRTYTQYTDPLGIPVADTSNFDLQNFLSAFFEQSEHGIFTLIFTALIHVLARIEQFESLVQAIQYDPYQVFGGHPSDWVILSFNKMWRVFDGDAHHLQWQGYVLPFGWYSGCSLLGDVVIVRNHDFFQWFFLLALVAAFWLIMIELFVKKVAAKYRFQPMVASLIIAFLVLMYITNRGSFDLLYPMGLLFLVGLLPRIRFSLRTHYHSGMVPQTSKGSRK